MNINTSMFKRLYIVHTWILCVLIITVQVLVYTKKISILSTMAIFLFLAAYGHIVFLFKRQRLPEEQDKISVKTQLVVVAVVFVNIAIAYIVAFKN